METLGTLLHRALRRHGDRTALVHEGRSRTYAELLSRGERLAAALHGLGLQPGDPVAAMLETRLESTEVFVAAALGGHPLVHVNDRLQPEEVAFVLRTGRARALVHTAGRSAVVAAVPGVAGIGPVITIGAGSPDDMPLGAIDLEDLLARVAGVATGPAIATRETDCAILAFTSGTTGFPKAVVVSHRAVSRAILHQLSGLRIAMFGRCAFTGSFSFVTGVWGVVLPHLVAGGTVHLAGGWTPDRVVDLIARERATFTYTPSPQVPAYIDQLSQRPDALTGLEVILHSGSALAPELVREMVGVVGDRFLESWGMTETVASLTMTTRDDWGPRCAATDIHASVGRASAVGRILVVDAAGREVAPGVSGEIVAESDTMFDGYLDDPSATAEVLTDGRLRTGDVGHLDAAGYLYVTDRSKDVIITGGINVYPAEVERCLADFDGVAEVAVFGLPDASWGEAVTAAVVPAAGRTVDPDALIAHVRLRLASYKKPTRVFVVDDLPRTVSLKVRKSVLRERFAGAGTATAQGDTV